MPWKTCLDSHFNANGTPTCQKSTGVIRSPNQSPFLQGLKCLCKLALLIIVVWPKSNPLEATVGHFINRATADAFPTQFLRSQNQTIRLNTHNISRHICRSRELMKKDLHIFVLSTSHNAHTNPLTSLFDSKTTMETRKPCLSMRHAT